MLERTSGSYFEDISFNGYGYDNKRAARQRPHRRKADESVDDFVVTRKTRNRRPRIPTIQSGYCAVCILPYNSIEDHIQSKKHQKLIGEDANYIALNNSFNGFLHDSNIPFLNLNGIDAIGVHETSFNDNHSSTPLAQKRRVMRRSRDVSCDVRKIKGMSPFPDVVSTGHHLRSRRNVNYAMPPSDDDALKEDDEEEGEVRVIRTSARLLLQKSSEANNDNHEEVWNSGRPKRACIKQKRLSCEDRQANNNKIYYKVEVLSKQRQLETVKRQQSQSPKREEDKDKGLIVKFKKLRNSELIQLNNEATNFLFPKKEELSSEEDEGVSDAERNNTTISSVENDESTVSSFSETGKKIKLEDEGSMDSSCSSSKKKKRRTHAEAFIMDNQKYYKFETPGSRLRYHGSYLPSIIKNTRPYAGSSPKGEDTKPEKMKKSTTESVARMKLNNYKFSFEKIPEHAAWYDAFHRQDTGNQRYPNLNDSTSWNRPVLPYQMSAITPLDPRTCMVGYKQLLRCLCGSMQRESESTSACTTPDAPTSTSSFLQDEDSKFSSLSSSGSTEDGFLFPSKRKRRAKEAMMREFASVKNPRKSPRQHASTLAILSGFIQQRKRRSRNKSLEDLPTIPEEGMAVTVTDRGEEKEETGVVKSGKTPGRKPKVDYFSIARKIDEEIDAALVENPEEFELEIVDDPVDFHNSKVNVVEILKLYEEDRSKETEKSCRRFFNGTPGRKPGRRKKKNKTGWPNKIRRPVKRSHSKDKGENDDSTVESASVNNDSDVESTVNDGAKLTRTKNEIKLENCDVDSRVDDKKDKVLTNKVTNSEFQFQPYVFVQKLDSSKLLKKSKPTSPQRTKRRQRHIPGSPKSPRILRRPRGRWYRER